MDDYAFNYVTTAGNLGKADVNLVVVMLDCFLFHIHVIFS